MAHTVSKSRRIAVALVASACALAGAVEPATKPSDGTIDLILLNPSTAPASGPSTAPVSPLIDRQADASRRGSITLSDGSKLVGAIATMPGKPLRVFDEQASEYIDVPFESIRSMKADVVWERDEPEWQFKVSGSDEKIYAGKTYPARELRYAITTKDGKTIAGAVAAPLYLKIGNERKTFILHKRDKGDVGKKLSDLIYVKQVELDPK